MQQHKQTKENANERKQKHCIEIRNEKQQPNLYVQLNQIGLPK
jgi:hypothetical protein